MALFSGTAPVLAQPSADEGHPLLPQLNELVAGLLLLGGVTVAAAVWMAVIRRGSRRQLEAIQRREAALDEHYRDLFENAHDILFTHDHEGRILSLNRAGEELLGYPRQEACQLKFTQLIVPEDRAAYLKVLEQLGTGTDRSHVEVTLIAKHGGQVSLRVNVRQQNLPSGAPQVQGIAWDITERRQAEEARRESEQRLRRSLEDRIRIGRDLHDGIIQSIYAIGLSLGECRRLIQEQPAEAASRLGQIIADLNGVIRDVRNFIVGLEPEALQGREFGTALNSVVASLAAGTTARFTLDVEPKAAGQLTGTQATHLLQIAREAITNAIRHGQATQVKVALQLREQGIRLEVQDDGTGFDTTTPRGSGFGLRNLEGRARELGARSQILSTPGEGTLVVVELPEQAVDATIRDPQDSVVDGGRP